MNKLIQSLCLLLTSSCFSDLLQDPPSSLDPGEYIWTLTGNQADENENVLLSTIRFILEDEPNPPDEPIQGTLYLPEVISFELTGQIDGTPISLSSEGYEATAYRLAYVDLFDGQGVDWFLDFEFYDLPSTFGDNSILDMSYFPSPYPSPFSDFISINNEFFAGVSQLELVPTPGALSFCVLGFIRSRKRRI